MANLAVDYSAMQETSSSLQAGEQDLISILNDLKAKVDQLVADGFVTDKASGAFQAAYEQFNSGATQTVQGLEGVVAYLNKAQESMSALDSDLASSLS